MHYYRNPDYDIQKSLAGAYKKKSRSREAIDSIHDSSAATPKEEAMIHLMDAYRESSGDPEAQRAILKRIRGLAARNPLTCQCSDYQRNPNSLDFVIDFYAMVDALKLMIDAAAQVNMSLPAEFNILHDKLNQAGPQLRVSEFSRIFAETVTPSGQEPSHTPLYRLIAVGRQHPQDPLYSAVLVFVNKARKVIQTFDFAKARDTQQLTMILMEMRRFVNDMLQEAYAQQLNLDADAREGLQNMERWKSSMATLNPHRLSLSTLNEFIRILQPTQPFGLSVYHLYRFIDPANAQQKAMEFMDIIGQISNLINPFTQEFAANDELTGWKYLHVPVP